MKKDERLYAFIVAHTSRSRSRIRRFSIHRRWLKLSGFCALILCGAAVYGFYGLAQQVAHLRVERENNRLREENQRQRQQLEQLENRVDRIEDASRRLSEISGEGRDEASTGTDAHGAGGPFVELDEAAVAALARRAAHLEEKMRQFADALRERAHMPSIWPVEGELTDNFGARRNPFGGGSSEFHSGLDIATAWGTPVVATGNGRVTFAGSQSGYGNVVYLDHGNGLTTRYGHLSKIEVSEGQELKRGEAVGRVGSTGRSTGPHLHYEVRINETAVSPRRYLPEIE
ncbi:MAG TPA: M23 family metallopeptidase [Pyrinomonadaceae bacterium]|nr:M23 family metallopeptidase [Pyrinomonadaceae bacterium]